MVYASLRAVIWLLCAIVPVIVWLFYVAVHSMAWLLRTVIVPGTLWLLSVGLSVMASRLYAAFCGLAQWLRNRDQPFTINWSGIQKILRPASFIINQGKYDFANDPDHQSARIPQMKRHPANSGSQFRSLYQALTIDQVAEFLLS